MEYAIAIAASVFYVGFTSWQHQRLVAARRESQMWQEKAAECAIEHDALAYALRTLRASCFITNAKGHRVRYVNATPAERARAEGC